MANQKMLTQVELELMTILWRIRQGSVTEVQGELNPGRSLAYTSVSTILRILEQKKIVGSRKEGRGHVYYPRLSKETYETTTLKHVLSKVFDDTPTALVKRLLEVEKLSEKDLKAIRALLEAQLS
jgi:predicted transcriptional regulator